MQITNIHIDHFQGIQHLSLDLEQPVTLVAGKNGSGKSTIREAIRLAILGDPGRVSKKKDYGALVTEGAKEGSVTVEVSEGGETGGFSMALPKGQYSVDGAINPPDIISYLIDADRFPALPPDQRRQVLREVSGVRASTDEVRRRLEERGCDLERAEEVIPMLRSGFDAAEKAAKDKATEARGAWKAVTGEQYGAKKAEGWAPDAPEKPGDEAVKEAEQQLEALNERQRKADALEQQRQEYERRHADLDARYQEAEAKAGDLEAAQAELGAAKAQLEEAEATHRDARQGLITAQNPLACPDCCAPLALIQEGDDAATLIHISEGLDEEDAQEREQQARQALADAKARYKAASDRLAAAETATRELEWVCQQLEELTPPGGEGAQPPEPDELEQTRSRYQELWDQAQAAIEGRRKADQAEIHHKEAQAWEAIAAALAPDGIPGDLLAEALEPFNDRLRETATATGWPQVHIGADMAITAGGRAYHLLSESEQWRAGAAIAEALAYVSGVRLLVLDRLDVLDIPARGQALQWLTGLADTHQVLVMGTLKALPEKLPAGVQGVWLEGGRQATTGGEAA